MATIYSNPRTTVFREIDNTTLNEPPGQRAPLVLGGRDFTAVTDVVTDVNLKPAPLGWYIGFAVALGLLSIYVLSVAYLLTTGVGVWGNSNNTSWGFPIVNFVFWVGIGHAGTLISAILYLFRQNWRTGINRFATSQNRHTAHALSAVWRFHPNWETGIRFDRLRVAAPHGDHFHRGRLDETALMLVWKPSHAQSVRLQYTTQGRAKEFEHPARRAIQLQYVLAFGAHGAHAY